jgi:hypothetical protein
MDIVRELFPKTGESVRRLFLVDLFHFLFYFLEFLPELFQKILLRFDLTTLDFREVLVLLLAIVGGSWQWS